MQSQQASETQAACARSRRRCPPIFGAQRASQTSTPLRPAHLGQIEEALPSNGGRTRRHLDDNPPQRLAVHDDVEVCLRLGSGTGARLALGCAHQSAMHTTLNAHYQIQAAFRQQHQQAHRPCSPAAGCRCQCCWLPHLLLRAGQTAGWPPAALPPPVAGACCSPPAAAAALPRLRHCRCCRRQRRRRWLAGAPLRNAGCFLNFCCGCVAVPGSAGSREALQRASSSPSWLRAVFCAG